MQRMIVTRDLVPANKIEQGTPSKTKIVGFSLNFEFESIECADRRLEERPSAKQYGKTAIPTGIYQGELQNHPKFGYGFLLLKVPDFDGVYFPHVANSKEDLKGCLGIGEKMSEVILEKTKEKVFFLSNSKNTKEKFNKFIEGLIGRGEIKLGDKIEVEVRRKSY